MSDVDAPPAIPTELQVYDSYTVDPQWQLKFTYIWVGVAAGLIALSFPHLMLSIKRGHLSSSFFGINESGGYASLGQKHPSKVQPVVPSRKSTPGVLRLWKATLSFVKAFGLWSPPLLDLNLGQIVLVVAYFVLILCCIVVQAPLVDNPNRAGFLAIAQLPVVFLLASKNSVLSLLLGAGNGWEKLNFLHRWAGRGLFFGGGIHGALWIRNHIVYDLPIIGQQKESSGVAAFSVLCVIVLSSLKPVRIWFYQVFFVIHILAMAAFFITLCYHTMYARPWIYPALAFYGLDLALRLVRFRVKDATLDAPDSQMTLITIRDCDKGWTAGQHVRLRVFFGARHALESHPLTIVSAPPETTCLSSGNGLLILGARANGDWTRALNKYTVGEAAALRKTMTGLEKEKEKDSDCCDERSEVPVHVMIDGPYGGCSVDLGNSETVLLIAGGSGITFTLGLLDDIVGRIVKCGRARGEKTRRIEFAWCIRSFGCIEWFAPILSEIAQVAAADPNSSLDLHISVFVTCLCNPEAVPHILNCDVVIDRPTVSQILKDLISPTSNETGRWSLPIGRGGGVAVCAAGPSNMTREASNATAGLALVRAKDLGGVCCHTEEYHV